MDYIILGVCVILLHAYRHGRPPFVVSSQGQDVCTVCAEFDF